MGFLFGIVFTCFVGLIGYSAYHDVNRNRCAKEHDVFTCEYVGQWQPASPKQD